MHKRSRSKNLERYSNQNKSFNHFKRHHKTIYWTNISLFFSIVALLHVATFYEYYTLLIFYQIFLSPLDGCLAWRPKGLSICSISLLNILGVCNYETISYRYCNIVFFFLLRALKCTQKNKSQFNSFISLWFVTSNVQQFFCASGINLWVKFPEHQGRNVDLKFAKNKQIPGGWFPDFS